MMGVYIQYLIFYCLYTEFLIKKEYSYNAVQANNSLAG